MVRLGDMAATDMAVTAEFEVWRMGEQRVQRKDRRGGVRPGPR